MKWLLPAAIVLLAVLTTASCNGNEKGARQPEVFSIPELGLRYTPPGGMEDMTPPRGLEARRHVTSNVGNVIEPVLSLSSPNPDTDRAWHSLTIFTFPRSNWSQLDDDAAKQKMCTNIAGRQASPLATPRTATYAGQSFVLLDFERNESPLVKRADIYATIWKGQLLAFAFVSNSGDDLKPMEESLKTLELSNN